MTRKKTQCLEDVFMDEEEEGTKLMTPRTKTSCNDVSNTPKEIGFA